MSKRLSVCYAFVVVAQVLLCSIPSRGSAILNPTGDPDMPVVCRSVDADVDIRGQFATTRLTFVFQHGSENGTEVEFSYTVPEGALATGFAYWAGNEKVVGRIVEKQQASGIYNAITARNRDPALVEMTARNTFRARIAPVTAHTDLRVELTMVQSLKSSQGGFTYTLPLAGLCGADDDFERVSVVIRAEPGPDVREVSNNYGLPIVKQGNAYTLQLSGINYRPPKDLNVRFQRNQANLHASSYAYRCSQGGDGFFALVLTPDHTLASPRVSIGGVSAYDVQVHATGVKANESLLVTGRYKTGGKAQVTLSGKGSSGALAYRGEVAFSPYPKAANLASKLWAAEKIESLSANTKNREEIIRLSLLHTLPSKYTSWLAVPKAEMERYRLEQFVRRNRELADKLAGMMAKGTDGTAEGKKLRTKFDALCVKAGVKQAEVLSFFLGDATRDLLQDLSDLYVAGKDGSPGYRQKMQRYVKLFGETESDALSTMKWYAGEHLNRLVNMTVYDKAGTTEAQQLEARLRELCGSDFTEQLRYATESVEGSLRDRYLSAKYGEEPDLKHAEKVLILLKRLRPDFDPDTDPEVRQERAYTTSEALSDISWKIVNYSVSGRKADPELQILRQRYEELNDVASSDTWYRENTLEAASASAMESRAWEIVELRSSRKPDTKRIKALESEMARLERDFGLSAREFVDQRETAAAKVTAARLCWAIIYGQESGAEAREDRRRLEQFCENTGTDVGEMLKNTAAAELDDVVRAYVYEKSMLNPRPEQIKKLEARLRRAEHLAGQSADDLLGKHMEARLGSVDFRQMEDLYSRLRAEVIKNRPDEENVAKLSEDAQSLLTQGRLESPERYSELLTLGTAIVEKRMDIRSALEQGDSQKASQAREQQAELHRRMDALHWSIVRPGDPLISVEAPEDAVQVVALMPDGEEKVLEYDPAKKRWECRFDIPLYAPEGDYPVSLVIVFKDGTRSVSTLKFGVDVTAPQGVGAISATEGNAVLKLDASKDTVRAVAVLPWGARVELADPAKTGRYSGIVSVPEEYRDEAYIVTFVLTDQAHNRTSITVDAGE